MKQMQKYTNRWSLVGQKGKLEGDTGRVTNPVRGKKENKKNVHRSKFREKWKLEIQSQHIPTSSTNSWSDAIVAVVWSLRCVRRFVTPGSSVHGISKARIQEWVVCHLLLQGIFLT